MSLATRCPHCRTTFRVTHDQLKLRAGLVRCGTCKEIFNGVEHLLTAQAATVGTPPPAERNTGSAVFPAAASAGTEARYDAPAPAPAVEQGADALKTTQEAKQEAAAPDASISSASPAQEAQDPSSLPYTTSTAAETPDPLTRMTLMDIRPADDGDQSVIDSTALAPAPDHESLVRTIDDLTNRPWRGGHSTSRDDEDEIDALDQDEPQFVRSARRQQRLGRAYRLLFVLGSLALLLSALAQGIYLYRNQIAALWPSTVLSLSQACTLIGCRVGLPARIESVSIEATELQALPGSNNFQLAALLRNRSSLTQAWPYLELTLNDAAEKPLARRVFAPAEYLPGADQSRGFAPASEKPVRLTLAVSQLSASGYRLYVFYP